MQIHLGIHAKEQRQERCPEIPENEILDRVRAHEQVLVDALRAGYIEVKVVVRHIAWREAAGGTGDRVVACVDPRNSKVKTILLRGSSQLLGDRRFGQIVVE